LGAPDENKAIVGGSIVTAHLVPNEDLTFSMPEALPEIL
jgi:hypothetical protein